MTSENEQKALEEIINTGESCTPCDSATGHCHLGCIVHRHLPALHSILGRLKIQNACRKTKRKAEGGK